MAMRLRVTWGPTRCCTVRADRTASVPQLKAAVAARLGVPPQEQRLFFETLNGSVELVAQEQIGSILPGYSADLELVRCSPGHAEWRKRVEKDWEALGAAPLSVRGDPEAVAAALRQNGRALRLASEEVRADRGLVQYAIQQEPSAIEFAAPELCADLDVILPALDQDPTLLRFAAPKLRADRKLLLYIVGQDGSLLEFAAEALQDDREVVLTAVQEYGRALRFASEDVRGDREVVLAAAQQDILALEYAAPGAVDQELLRAALGDGPGGGGDSGPLAAVEGERLAPVEAPAPAAYEWMGIGVERPPTPPGQRTHSGQGHGAAGGAEEAPAELDPERRLEIAVHWRLERGSVAHRWWSTRLPQPPCCQACLLGRHLWCPACGPAGMPEARQAMNCIAVAEPAVVEEEERKVQKFLGGGLGWSAADLQTSAFKGVPS